MPTTRRRVLLLVDLEPTRELLLERNNDAMEVTTRAFDHNVLLPSPQVLRGGAQAFQCRPFLVGLK